MAKVQQNVEFGNQTSCATIRPHAPPLLDGHTGVGSVRSWSLARIACAAIRHHAPPFPDGLSPFIKLLKRGLATLASIILAIQSISYTGTAVC